MTEQTLESLPIELRFQILLYIPDLQSLRSIALASPAFYEAYHLSRHEVLLNILQRQLDGLVEIHEAIAAVRSTGLHKSKLSNREDIIALLDDRRRCEEICRLRNRSSSKRPLPNQPADLNEIIDLLKLHRIALWFLDDYVRNAPCPFWMDQAEWKSQVLPLKLSIVEKQRWLRAFYRLQTYCNLFGALEHPVDSPDHHPPVKWYPSEFEEDEIWPLFFGPLAPWETEEFACLWMIFHDRHEERYMEIANDLKQYGNVELMCLPKHLGILPSAVSYINANTFSEYDYGPRWAFTCLGPSFLFKFLHMDDYKSRRDTLLANAHQEWYSYPDTWSDARPLLYPADRFNLGMDIDGLRALLSTLPDIQRPNISWEKTWISKEDEGYPLYDEMYTTGHRSRRCNWGYALWDNQRLSQWESKWGAPLKDFGDFE